MVFGRDPFSYHRLDACTGDTKTYRLAWPREWRVTFLSSGDVPYVSEANLKAWCEIHMCCEKRLHFQGLLHHQNDNCLFWGPMLFLGSSGKVYVFSPFPDNAMYYVASDFAEFSVVGLRHFYPVSLSVTPVPSVPVLDGFLRDFITFDEIIDYRDKHIGYRFVLWTYPFDTFAEIIDLSSVLFTESDLQRFAEKIDEERVSILFLVTSRVNGDWKDMIILIADTGRLFVVSGKHVYFLARNISEFLCLGCNRFLDNRRYPAGCFSNERIYDATPETRYSIRPKCSFGKSCRRGKGYIFRVLLQVFDAVKFYRSTSQKSFLREPH
ncbi:tegument protein [Suid betaherpesvirus 2]|uniref:Tegument protein n=1 Tax=Suid betaherpesvirus 2 TaxID=1608255 RepID=U3GS17_9BETA|nr:tegument protein [Suid betaherpesvirus 2]AGT99219.1 tegument protein [Suid betaherpesvirus 2]